MEAMEAEAQVRPMKVTALKAALDERGIPYDKKEHRPSLAKKLFNSLTSPVQPGDLAKVRKYQKQQEEEEEERQQQEKQQQEKQRRQEEEREQQEEEEEREQEKEKERQEKQQRQQEVEREQLQYEIFGSPTPCSIGSPPGSQSQQAIAHIVSVLANEDFDEQAEAEKILALLTDSSNATDSMGMLVKAYVRNMDLSGKPLTKETFIRFGTECSCLTVSTYQLLYSLLPTLSTTLCMHKLPL